MQKKWVSNGNWMELGNGTCKFKIVISKFCSPNLEQQKRDFSNDIGKPSWKSSSVMADSDLQAKTLLIG